MNAINSHADIAPFVCDRCCLPVEDVQAVVTESGYRGDRDQPGYDPTIENWCDGCVKRGGHLAVVVEEEDSRERAEDGEDDYYA